MRTAPRLSTALAAISLTLVACGGSSDGAETPDAAATDETPVEEPTEAAPVDTPVEAAPVETPVDEPADDASVEEAPTDEVPADEVPADETPAGETVTASLVEWAVDAPTEYSAGTITFDATNNGSVPHELVVIRGAGYESLPLTDGGAVIEDELPEGDLIARTARLGGGTVEALTVDLEPGNYVLICNLGGGSSSSHAGKGQNLDIVVS